ncbi:MAG TPA: oligosaccharide flippase family protein [Candidatus Dormibacteraeota bacterium]|nr:oligosaccharide flippase family protein [Candidatus Dormibacteraeota bacterium]
MTRLTRNLIANVTGQGLVLVLSVIAVRFIFRHLGDDVFGIIFFNIVLTQLVTSALELGVSATIVREVSSHLDTEPGYVRSVIGTASTLYWGAGVLLVVLIWLVAPFLVTHWVNLTSLDPNTAATMLRIMSATSLVVLPKALYTSIFRGRQLMHINNSIDVIATAVQQGGILAVLVSGGQAYAVAVWISVSALLSVAAYVLMAARQVGWRTLAPSFSREVVRRNLGFTGGMMVISILSLVHIQAAQVIVSKLVPIAQFGFYSFASNTVNRGSFVTTAAAQAAFPSFSALHASGDRYGLMQQYRKLQDLVCFGVLPLFAGICFAALPVYTFVFNESVAGRLLLPTAFLALGSWMNGTLNMPYMMSIAMGRPQIAARTNVYALFVVLPVTAALIAVYGLPGAAFSWVFYHLFMYAYMVPRIARECLDLPPWPWFVQVLKVLGLAGSTYGIAWLAVTATGMFTLPVLAVAYLLGSIGFALGAYLMIGSDLRETLQRMRGSLLTRKANVM